VAHAGISAAEPPVNLTGPGRHDRAASPTRWLPTDDRLVEWLPDPTRSSGGAGKLCLSNFVDAVVATAIGPRLLHVPRAATRSGTSSRPTKPETSPRAWPRSVSGTTHGRIRRRTSAGAARLSMARRPGRVADRAGAVLAAARGGGDALPTRPGRTTAVLSEQAPALTMGELVRLLDRRAELVADLWNDWPRARPLLMLPSRD